MIKMFYLFFALTLAACTMPAAQPFRALSHMPGKNAPSAPTTNAALQDDANPQPPTKERPRHCTVTAAAWLNLRSGPGVDFPILGGLARGAVVEVHNQRGAWLDVTAPGGRRGWIHSAYCNEVMK